MEVAMFSHCVLGDHQNLARLSKIVYWSPGLLLAVAKFGSFHLWMVGCHSDNITTLNEKKP
jgi:hypothetical protein